MAATVLRVVGAALRCLTALVWNPAFRNRSAPGALVDCDCCRSDFFCPIDWAPSGDACWSIRLRCGACEVWRDVVVSDEDAQRFERALAGHGAIIARTVARLDRERMAIELDTFVAALECDVIDPSSFVR